MEFKHQPLDLDTRAIRLIEVLPTAGDEIIRCSIRLAKIDDGYTCLSYTWGDSVVGERSILINNQPFAVRKNLWEFLKVASHRALGGVHEITDPDFNFTEITQSLWIDALCIDQSNIAERNHQVGQMGAVYSSAQNVLAWFGKCPDHVDYRKLDFGNKDHVSLIGDNEYFKRAWITQELVLAKKVYYLLGNHIFDSDVFLEQTKKLILDKFCSGYDCKSSGQLCDRCARVALLGRPKSEMRTLLHNAMKYSTLKCGNPRDKIYSLLGISSDGARMPVDYQSSTSELINALCVTSEEFSMNDAKDLPHLFSSLGLDAEVHDPNHLRKVLVRVPYARSGSRETPEGCLQCKAYACQPDHSSHGQQLQLQGLKQVGTHMYPVRCLRPLFASGYHYILAQSMSSMESPYIVLRCPTQSQTPEQVHSPLSDRKGYRGESAEGEDALPRYTIRSGEEFREAEGVSFHSLTESGEAVFLVSMETFLFWARRLDPAIEYEQSRGPVCRFVV